jgi:hypothetical protein
VRAFVKGEWYTYPVLSIGLNTQKMLKECCLLLLPSFLQSRALPKFLSWLRFITKQLTSIYSIVNRGLKKLNHFSEITGLWEKLGFEPRTMIPRPWALSLLWSAALWHQ